MQKYIMSLDQGTTSSRCIIFDHSGNIISLAGQEFPQIFPNSGWVEHDPVQIWSSQLAVMKGALTKASLTAADIKSIGITNQRETTVIWDKKSGVPIYNAIVWQCRRTAEMVEELKNCGMSDYIREKTGLVPDAYFSATKIAWLLDNVEGARTRAEAGELIFGTIDTWLIWNLTGGKLHVTDYTNASRTMLFDIHNLYWDEKILDALNIPKCILPNVHPSSYHFGETDPSILGTSIPLTGIAGDQQAALFGHCCFEKGDVKNTYGTGCFLLMNTGKEAIKSRHGLITTIAATMSDNVDYALEGSVFVAGAAIQWLRDGMRMIKSAAESEDYAEKVADTEGAYLVPAFTGLGAPYWNPYARGIMVGITRGFTKEHFIRAALESIAYQTADVLSAMEVDLGVKINGLKVCG
ncbi:MAG: glycerol kinase GlpK, partial [Lachnospiraceae bacterium]|nr:glycerol kinase GlpK [Lachnospiraceae bacterium]